MFQTRKTRYTAPFLDLVLYYLLDLYVHVQIPIPKIDMDS
jgi:hypothetical protein